MSEQKKRPNWDKYFMRMAELVASRSTCLRRSVGAILVREKRILATGYNGAPQSIAHCSEVGCLREKMGIPSGSHHELCRGIHAEQNAIIQAALFGVSTKGATLYCTTKPCVICLKMIINAGIEKLVVSELYDDDLADEILKEAGIPMILISQEEYNSDE